MSESYAEPIPAPVKLHSEADYLNELVNRLESAHAFAAGHLNDVKDVLDKLRSRINS